MAERVPAGILALAAFTSAACAGDGIAPALEQQAIEISISGLAPLDASIDGRWEAWVVDANGAILSAGRFAAVGEAPIVVTNPIDEPAYLMVTLEPPGDSDATPSLMKLLGGRFGSDGVARLEVTGYLTPVGMPLQPAPGVHILATRSAGAPQDAGLWLVDTRADSSDASYFQTFTPLTSGWTYEGWIVMDLGDATETWLSYGQFVPNNLRRARYRDDTGIGPYSGFADWRRALTGSVHYPGDDWLANPGGYPLPAEVSLPIDLNGDDGAGRASRWTHVITIEPRYDPGGDRSEPPWDAKPFFLRPYENAIGEEPPAQPRIIGFVPETLPRGSARLVER